MNEQFISCDWGTTSFRLKLIDAATLNILAEVQAEQGIAATYKLWEAQADKDRTTFYMEFLQQQTSLLQQEVQQSIDGLVIIVSGMASATIGMLELPYKQIPMQADAADFDTHVFEATAHFNHTVVLVSGLRSGDDVMRGEETMITGCEIAAGDAARLLIFPGTHSKHVLVQNGSVVSFKTYMTGEVFDLLSNKSILAASIDTGPAGEEEAKAFRQGVRDSAETNLLNNIFHVRTNQLFGAMDKACNYHYLSGLLIGEELKDLKNIDYNSITIVSSGALSSPYTQALEVLDSITETRQTDAAAALINGQSLVFQHHLNKKIVSHHE